MVEPLRHRQTKGAGEAAAPDGDDIIAEVHGSRDFREGVSSFLEERAARWSGA
jgi:hypothetical protein